MAFLQTDIHLQHKFLQESDEHTLEAVITESKSDCEVKFSFHLKVTGPAALKGLDSGFTILNFRLFFQIFIFCLNKKIVKLDCTHVYIHTL